MKSKLAAACWKATLVITVLTCCTAAQAEESKPKLAISVEGTAAIAGPLGFAGLGVTIDLHRTLALNLGFGEGQRGTQIAAALRLTPFATSLIDFGVGYSTGPAATPFVGSIFDEDETEQHWDRAHWVNAEVGGVKRWNRSYVRWFAGIGMTANAPDYSCSEKSCGLVASRSSGGDRAIIPYVGLSAGLRFSTSLMAV